MEFKVKWSVLGLSALVILGGNMAMAQATQVSAPAPQAITQGEMISELGQLFREEVPQTVYFEFDKYDLDDEARARLDAQAEWILSYPDVRFAVYGHTDKVGSNDYNAILGLRRAQTVVDYLVSKGISADRLEAMVSYGEEQPAIMTLIRERQNRRTITEVMGFVEGFGEEMVLSNLILPDEGNGGPNGGGPAITPPNTDPEGEDPNGEDPNGEDPNGEDPNGEDPNGDGNDPAPGNPGNHKPQGNAGEDPNGRGGWGEGDKGTSNAIPPVTPPTDGKPEKSRTDAGRGNGDEDGDPGRSGSRNRGGDEDSPRRGGRNN